MGMLAFNGEAGLGKVKTIGPFTPNGASCTCAALGDGRLWVHWMSSAVAAALRSAVQLAVDGVTPGGTACDASALNSTMSTVRVRICPRISPAGRPAVWMFR